MRTWKTWLSFAFVVTFIFLFDSHLQAQTFAPVPALSFTKAFGGANPLPQTITIASPSSSFNFTIAAITFTGTNNWLGISNVSSGNCTLCPVPQALRVSVAPVSTLPVGSYTGQIVATSQVGGVTLTIPVTLTVAAAGSAFFDNLPGQMSFFMRTNGTVPPTQSIQVRNGGSGSFSNWSMAASTSDGGAWIAPPSTSGSGPSTLNISIVKANLPGAGAIPGTYVGQLLFQLPSGNVTVPVSVVVGPSVFSQVNPLAFTKVFSGADPLPQTIAIASTGNAFNFSFTSATATGGNWLTVSKAVGGICTTPCSTPQALTVQVNPLVTLVAATYTGQVVITAQDGSSAMTIPVNMTVVPAGQTFIDNIAGQMSFSLVTSGTTIAGQTFQIRNGGPGNLFWGATGSTSDGGPWLTVLPPNGTAPSTVTVAISVPNLPSGGLVAGTFVGQVLVQAATGNITVPVSVVVGASVFNQVSGLSFTKPFGVANPPSQTFTVSGIGTPFNFTFTSSTATGGSWLTVSNASSGHCTLCPTPQTLTATVTASSTLAAGTYTGQIVISAQDGSTAMTLPVTLTVAPASGSYFGSLPGQVGFAIQTGGGNPLSQSFQVQNGGAGSLVWTATPSTSDGGAWLTATPGNGSAPGNITVGVVSSALPGGGSTPGTFTGQIALLSASGNVTIPVSVVVGTSVFSQLPGLSFSKAFGRANPISQTISIASTSAALNFTVSATTITGNWLSISTAGACAICSTPNTATVSVIAASSLPVGTYTGQIIATTQDGTMSVTMPVILVVTTGSLKAPTNVGIFRSGFFWLQDVDGNQAFNSPPDRAFAFGGIAGDIPISGDWNGSGTSKVGVYRPSNGLFVLDYDGDGQFTVADKAYNLGAGIVAGDIPVVGDWNGDGKTKVGLFRSGFFWILDYNGNGVFEQGIDRTYAFGGIAGDVPVVGDWNGSGTSKIGLFRSGFYWILDANGNGSLDNINGVGGDKAFAFGGIAGDVPMVGDWNGDGTSKVGVFRFNFFWVLDANGNTSFDGTGVGQDYAFPFGGITGDKAVVGKW